jgi:steroid 5-alpha reductase family enzyme
MSNVFPAGEVITDCLRTLWGIGLCVTIPTNIILYLIFLYTNTNTLVDFGWSFMQFLLACLCFALRQEVAAYKYEEAIIKSETLLDQVPIRNIICLILFALWSARLAGWILVNRICKGENDARYEALAHKASGEGGATDGKPSAAASDSTSGKAKDSGNATPAANEQTQILNPTATTKHDAGEGPLASEAARKRFFAIQFTMQAVLVVLPATPIYFVFGYSGQQKPQEQWSFWVGLVLVCFGVINTHISDLQIENYKHEQAELRKKNGTRTKGLCRVGWWKYSRHPNLFFEVITWIGFSFLGLDPDGSLVSIFGFFGPFILFLIMKYLTVPATEESMKSTRPDWDQMIEGTNMFAPFPLSC